MKRKKWKEKMARLMVAALILQFGTGTGHAASGPGPVLIPTGDIDLTILASIPASIDLANTFLVKWRTGTANQTPLPATSLSFAYLTGSNVGLPTRTTPADNSANNQGDLWSDNAVQVAFQKGNSLATAILIYSSNTVTGVQDPLGNVSLRGGLVGCTTKQTVSGQQMVCSNPADPARASVIPLIWKALSGPQLAVVSTATVSGSFPIPTTSPLFMPTEITTQTGGACAAEGPYAASTRVNNGFCDYSTHYFLDTNNTDPNNKWYTAYPTGSTQHDGAFNYASLVGPFGVNTTEQGAGAGQFTPMYAVLGTNLTNAIQAHYGTTIYVEVLSR